MRKKTVASGLLAGAVFLLVFFFFSSWLAPIAAEHLNLNPYYYLSWGAPAVFYEDIDGDSALLKLEPWRILGLQLPAVASIKPTDWTEVVVQPPPAEPVFPEPPSQTHIVGIYHSHASEAFVPSSTQARSTDFSQTVVRLGKEIEGILTAQGIVVIHSKEYHDRIYNQSYSNSRKTALDMVTNEANIALLLDIHRDGVGATSAQGRAITTSTIRGQGAGKIAFVISTDHPNWQSNFTIANDLHNIMENKYPGLSRGIITKARATYHQDLHHGAILVEVGGHWNSLEEAIYGAQLFAEVLVDYYKGGR